jgi:ABC-2 type transport system permease protein
VLGVTTDRAVIRALLWKSWLETRTRFLASATILALLGISTVLRARPTIEGWESFHSGETMPYALYVWLSLSHGYLMFFWVTCAVLLGLGGLRREESAGTAGFTLALPVSRSSLVASRAITGAAEAFVLALVPGVLVALLSPIIGRGYSLSQAMRFGVLMAGGGMMFYALGFLLSQLLRGEYAAPGVGLALTAAVYVLAKLPFLHRYDPFALMTGSRHMVEGTYLLAPGFPAAPLAVCLGVAGALLLASDALARRLELHH